jgi:hypothetical protein
MKTELPTRLSGNIPTISLAFVVMVVRRGLRWIYNKLVANAQRCIISILTAGPVPRHIAFVMDGNRRYARIHGKKVHQGHMEGFTALHRVSIDLLQTGFLSSR